MRGFTLNGFNLVIHDLQFWLVLDWEMLAEEQTRHCPFWLRIGFDRWWPLNFKTPSDARDTIRRAMVKTGQIVRDEQAGQFAMSLPFEADRCEADLIRGILTGISNLGAVLDELLK